MFESMPALFAYAPPWAWASACGALALVYFLAWPRRKAEGLPRGEAARRVAAETGLPRRRLYRAPEKPMEKQRGS